MEKHITLNHEQKLYVIPCGDGYTCLGFGVAYNKGVAIACELNRNDILPKLGNVGTLKGYLEYLTATNKAFEYHLQTNKRLECNLTKQLIGLEGRRVEVVTTYDEKRRFIVGKSTGYLPCHLEIKTKRSHGGGAAESEYKSVKLID